jgi:hypothetical protein
MFIPTHHTADFTLSIRSCRNTDYNKYQTDSMSWPSDPTFVILPAVCFLIMTQIIKNAQMPKRLTRNLTDHPSRSHNCCKTIHQIKHQSSSFLFSSLPLALLLILILILFPCTSPLRLRRSDTPRWAQPGVEVRAITTTAPDTARAPRPPPRRDRCVRERGNAGARKIRS